MPVTRSSMAAAIEAELDSYFATTSGSIRPDFAQFLANLIADAAQDAVKSAAGYVAYTTQVNVAPPIVSTIISPAGPCTGTLAVNATATTTATCVIP